MPEVLQSLTLPRQGATNGKNHGTLVTKGQYPTTRGSAPDTFTLGQRFIDFCVKLVHRLWRPEGHGLWRPEALA